MAPRRRQGECRNRLSRWAALSAAHLLVLQTLFAAFALGAGANAQPLDAFGNVICAFETGGSAHGDGGAHHAFPGCCTLGCGMFAPALATPDGNPGDLPQRLLRSTPVAHVSATHAIGDRPFHAGRPRAPPTA